MVHQPEGLPLGVADTQREGTGHELQHRALLTPVSQDTAGLPTPSSLLL